MKKSAQKSVVVTQDAAYRALDCAVASGQLGVVTALMEQGLSATTVVNGHTVLYTAVEKGHREIIKFLIGKGGDPNEKKDGFDLLSGVCRKIKNGDFYEQQTNIKTAVVLIENGANLYGDYPDTSLLRALLDLREVYITEAIVYSKRGANLKAAWVAAAYIGKLSALQEMHPRFLQNMPAPREGEQVVDAAVLGLTALSAAVLGKHVDVVKFLLEQGANPDVAGGLVYNSPLHRAVRFDVEKIVHLLVDKGANLERVDEDGYTPLAHAVAGKKEALIKILVGKGANILAPMKGYENIFEGIRLSGKTECIEALLLSPQVKANPELQAEVEFCVAAARGQVDKLGNFKFEAKPVIEACGTDSELKELELQPIPKAVIVARQEKETPFAQLAEGFQEGVQLVPADGNPLKAKVE